jgi:hypothetical protein
MPTSQSFTSEGDSATAPSSPNFDAQPVTNEGSVRLIDGGFASGKSAENDHWFFSESDIEKLRFDKALSFGSYQGYSLIDARIRGKIQFSALQGWLKTDGDKITIKGPAGGLAFKSWGVVDVILREGPFEVKIPLSDGPFEFSAGASSVASSAKAFVTSDGSFGLEGGFANTSLKVETEVNLGRGVDFFTRNLLDAFYRAGGTSLPPGL